MAANYTAIVESVPEIEVELGKRIPNGWRAFPIGPAGSHQNALISFSKDILSIENQGVLRVAVALDEREEKVLQVVIPETRARSRRDRYTLRSRISTIRITAFTRRHSRNWDIWL